MAEKEILLTISMLVSGSPENVRRSLESLREIRENVSCELSITDTGCSPETRAVIEEYADTIHSFTWCKDFSKARNYGLERAKGQWFLFLDDDEWFEDMKEMIHFFTSGAYKKYQFAYYVQRNYENVQGSKWSDAPVLRLIKLESDTHFIYSIHECLWPVVGQGIRFSTYVHHYGYVYASKAEKFAKSRRNVELLLQEHEKEPKDLHHIVQLVQEYGSIKEYMASLDYSEKGIAIWWQDIHHDVNVYRFMNSLYANVSQCLLLLFRYKDLVEKCRGYIEQGDADPLARALMTGRMAVAYFELGEYTECCKCVQVYVAAYEKQLAKRDCYFNYETSLTSMCFEPALLQLVLDYGMRAALQCGKYELLLKWVKLIDWKGEVVYAGQQLIRELVKELQNCKSIGRESVLEVCNCMLQREALATKFSEEIIMLAEGDFLPYCGLMSEHWFFGYLYLWYCAYVKQKPDAIQENLRRLWKNPLAVLKCAVKLNVWQVLKNTPGQLEGALAEIPYYHWCKAVDIWVGQGMPAELGETLVAMEAELTQECSYHCYLRIAVLEKQLAANPDHNSRGEKLEQYYEANMLLYDGIYTEEAVEQCFDMLPRSLQLAMVLTQIQLLAEEGQLQEAVQLLAQVKRLAPELAQMVKTWLEEIRSLHEEYSKDIQVAGNEFHALAQQVKERVKQLLAEGNAGGAMEILVQLEQMLPGDVEVDALKQKIVKLNT